MSNTVRYYGDRILRNRIKNLEEHNQRKINKSIKKFKHRHLPGGITFTQRRKFATKAKAKGSFHDNHSSHSFDNGLSFKYIFDSILSVFGKDVNEIIFAMITFADGQKPPVLKALEERKIPSQRSFRFNNSALYAESGHPADCSDQGYNAIDKDAFNKMFWKMGMTNFKEFFSELWKVEPKSLTLTQEVLKERENLEASVQGLEERVRMTLMKIGELEKEQHILEKYQANVEANKNFRYEIKVPKFHQIELEGGKFVTNCLKCKSTCHYPCRIPQDKDKDRCRAMKSGKCTVCDNNCAWNVHVNNSYRIEVTWLTETRTFDNLKQRYADALKQKGQKETVLNCIHADIEKLNGDIMCMIQDIRNCLQRLEEIALKPDPLSTVDYIDTLIQSEENEANPGFKDRVNVLQKIRKRAEVTMAVKKGEYRPFPGYEHLFNAKVTLGSHYS